MTLRIAHASDLHGDLDPLFDLVEREGQPDVWVLSGDMFPNDSRGCVEVEVPFQEEWAADFSQEIAEVFAGRQVILVPGNHDYADLAAILRTHGAIVHEITPEGVEVCGLRWAGFREIPYIAGEWAGETHEFQSLVERTFASQPDILVTHAPAAGILDGEGHSPGISELMTALAYRPHSIQAHFFGHIHESYGVVKEMGVLFSNAATVCRTVEVSSC